ncbi:MAG: asparaginase domain-containing protein, partial [Thalassobaculaceae bacterium]
MAKPKITVLSLGGTISMVQGKSGVVPGLNADDLIAAAPGIDDLAVLTAESRPPVGSSDLTPEGIFDVARR